MERHKAEGWQRQPSNSIDGFVRRPSSYQPNRQRPTPSLDNFVGRTDGFQPSRPNTIRTIDQAETEEASLLDEPIVLDHIEERKRKLRFWQRHAKFKRVLKRTAFACTLVVLAAGGYFGYKLYHTEKQVLAGGGRAATVCSDNVDTSLLTTEGDSRINILLLGIGGPGHDGSDLTDTIILASVDPITNKVVLLSVPRDLWVKIPGDGYQKINAAYAYGKQQSTASTESGKTQDGITLLDKTLQNVLDVPIHYHALVDFTAFKQSVDAVGGITVDVPETLYDPTIAWENHWNPVIARKGLQTFDGSQALLYVRSRETSSDFARAERQRLVITALKQKIFTLGTFSNPLKVSSLLSSLGSNVYTDFDSGSMKCLYHQLSTIPSSAINSLDMVTPPHNLLTTGNMNGLSIVEPRDGLFDYDAIQKFVHKSLPDGLITREGAKVAIYNATNTAGLATTEADTLKSYGYDVTTVDNAGNASSPAASTLVDLSRGQDKYTRHYLEDRLGVSADDKVPAEFGVTPPVGTDFVIILGEDAANSATL